MTIVSIHQPHFLPWMGYFNKALHSQVFVWLHSVQYRKNYFQNRTMIKQPNDQSLWLTLPVHAKMGMNIDQVTIADPKWRDRVRKTVEMCYKKTPYFAECWPSLSQALNHGSENLDEINFHSFLALVQILGCGSLRVERAGNLPVSSDDPTIRLVEICAGLGATHYIAGKGGQNYLRPEEFEKAGIKVVWQAFHPETVVYRQLGPTFLPGLSIIDCLFNEGPAKTKELALSAWAPTLA